MSWMTLGGAVAGSGGYGNTVGMAALYDSIGVGYAGRRVPDPRWAERIRDALGDARTVVNVGAGAGSYEPTDRFVVAVEPSRSMVSQRPEGAAPVVRGVAGALPFSDGAFEAAMAILTTHHWPDAAAGLAEMQRVSQRQVVVTWDPEAFAREFWLVRDYLPWMAEHEHHLAAGPKVAELLGEVHVAPLPVPHDCSDGFFGAYWRRPEAYLDPEVRASISGLALADPGLLEPALARLRADIGSGEWAERHGDLRRGAELDLGYQVIVGRREGRGEK